MLPSTFPLKVTEVESSELVIKSPVIFALITAVALSESALNLLIKSALSEWTIGVAGVIILLA